MGLAKGGRNSIVPIYTHLYNEGLVEYNEFTLCLGKNGGRFIIGGYDDKLKVHPDLPITWIPMINSSKMYINIKSIEIGNKKMSKIPSKAMIDSGTTFTYLSRTQLDEIDSIMQELCKNDTYECKGKREKPNK